MNNPHDCKHGCVVCRAHCQELAPDAAVLSGLVLGILNQAAQRSLGLCEAHARMLAANVREASGTDVLVGYERPNPGLDRSLN